MFLLARYFNTTGLFSDLNYAAMKEDKPDELFAAWLDLPDKQRNAMDAEFREIFEMICEKGFRAWSDCRSLALNLFRKMQKVGAGGTATTC